LINFIEVQYEGSDEMRKINFKEHDQKRKEAKIDLLKLRDQLGIKSGSGGVKRNPKKREILFKLAKKRKEKMIEKIGERKYRLLKR
jgi:altronate dehydratase